MATMQHDKVYLQDGEDLTLVNVDEDDARQMNLRIGGKLYVRCGRKKISNDPTDQNFRWVYRAD